MKMYKTSPMESFNKNNPFIIIAKRKYDNIVDLIQAFSKNCIKGFIINTILCILINIFLVIKTVIIHDNYWLYGISVVFIIGIFLSIYLYRRKIRYFMALHPNMKEFDKISELGVNDILALNNEDVLKCVNGLYELEGELYATKNFYSLTLKVYVVVEIIVLVLSIIYLTY